MVARQLYGLLFWLVFAGASANAATLTVSYQGSNEFGSPNLSRQATISSSTYGLIDNVNSGMFRLTGSGGFGDFLAFCVDLATPIKNNQIYTTATTSGFGAAVDANIAKLFTSAYASVDTALEAAGFQLALWEIISDTGSGWNFMGGTFRAWNNAAAVTQAMTYLNGLVGASTNGYNVTYLISGRGQNLVTVSPVPLPASAAMLGLGLAGLIGLKRRRKAA